MVAIRSAATSDIGAVLALWLEAGAQPSHTDDAASLAALVEHDPGAVIVAEESGRIVGSVIAGWDGWRGSIYRLAVARGERRAGLATKLLDAAERRLTGAGAVRSQAIVVATDDGATGFWRASDWEEQTERLRFVKG